MPIRPDGPAPYAPPASVLDVIKGFRDRGLSKPFTPDVLIRAGVTESLVPRVLKSLEVLELIGEDGNPTAALEGLRRATSEEFVPRLAEIVRGVYAEVFAFTDPAKDDAARIADAFRSFTPPGQRGRMVTLFLGLCEAAGIVTQGTARKQATPTGGRAAPTARKAATPLEKIKRGIVARQLAHGNTTAYDREQDLTMRGLPPAISGLLASLPGDGKGWPQAQRDRWLKTFETVLDFSVPIRETEPPTLEEPLGE